MEPSDEFLTTTTEPPSLISTEHCPARCHLGEPTGDLAPASGPLDPHILELFQVPTGHLSTCPDCMELGCHFFCTERSLMLPARSRTELPMLSMSPSTFQGFFSGAGNLQIPFIQVPEELFLPGDPSAFCMLWLRVKLWFQISKLCS